MQLAGETLLQLSAVRLVSLSFITQLVKAGSAGERMCSAPLVFCAVTLCKL